MFWHKSYFYQLWTRMPKWLQKTMLISWLLPCFLIIDPMLMRRRGYYGVLCEGTEGTESPVLWTSPQKSCARLDIDMNGPQELWQITFSQHETWRPAAFLNYEVRFSPWKRDIDISNSVVFSNLSFDTLSPKIRLTSPECFFKTAMNVSSLEI